MSEPFVAEIRIFAGNFAPRGWALCNGQLMAISQNTALFSLLGTTYGGDGKSTFGLPNLQGNAPMHWGQGPGLTDRVLGEMGGSSTVTLISSTIPAHSHQLLAAPSASDGSPISGGVFSSPVGARVYQTAQSLVTMNPQMLSFVGGSLPHNNMQPYLTLLFIIALQGIYPPRG